MIVVAGRACLAGIKPINLVFLVMDDLNKAERAKQSMWRKLQLETRRANQLMTFKRDTVRGDRLSAAQVPQTELDSNTRIGRCDLKVSTGRFRVALRRP